MPATPAFTPDYTFVNLPLADELEILTDEVELALNGGQASDDSPYPRTFLRLCMEQAKDKLVADTETANLAVLQTDYSARKKDEMETYFLDLKAKSDLGESPDRWIQSMPVVFLFDTDRGQYYFVLPQALVNLRRYQNLPNEYGVWDIQARNVQLRDQYRFAQARVGSAAFRHGPGGSLGRFMFSIEQNTGITALADQYRCYITTPKFDTKLPDSLTFIAYYVLRDARTSGLPDPPLRMVTRLDMVRLCTEFALLRTRQDKLVDASPTPTNPVQ